MMRTSSIFACILLLLSPSVLAEPDKNLRLFARDAVAHPEMHDYVGQGKFRHGVFPADSGVGEGGAQRKQNQPADAARIVELVRRQDNSSSSSVPPTTSNPPPSTDSSTSVPPPTETTTTTTTTSDTTTTSVTDSGPTTTTTTSDVPPPQDSTTTTPPPPPPPTTTEETTTEAPPPPPQSTTEVVDETSTTFTTTRSLPRTTLSTSTRTTTIGGVPHTIVTLVVITPTPTAPRTPAAITNTAGSALQTGAAADRHVELHYVAYGMGALMAGALLL